jgi:hypothetical protein
MHSSMILGWLRHLNVGAVVGQHSTRVFEMGASHPIPQRGASHRDSKGHRPQHVAHGEAPQERQLAAEARGGHEARGDGRHPHRPFGGTWGAGSMGRSRWYVLPLLALMEQARSHLARHPHVVQLAQGVQLRRPTKPERAAHRKEQQPPECCMLRTAPRTALVWCAVNAACGEDRPADHQCVTYSSCTTSPARHALLLGKSCRCGKGEPFDMCGWCTTRRHSPPPHTHTPTPT